MRYSHTTLIEALSMNSKTEGLTPDERTLFDAWADSMSVLKSARTVALLSGSGIRRRATSVMIPSDEWNPLFIF